MCIWQKLMLLKDLNRKPKFGFFPLGNLEPKAASSDRLMAVFLEQWLTSIFCGFGAKSKQTKELNLNLKAALSPKFDLGIWALVYMLLGKW